MEDIKKNLDEVKSRIADAAEKSGRSFSDITLVAVTKLHEADEINRVLELGIPDIAENKVQELVRKYDAVKGNHRWHLIGHLQTNKVKQAVGRADLIQSVDSLHLAAEIDKRAAAAGIVQDILIQINAAGEAQKSGISIAEGRQLARDILTSCPNIKVKGLMHIAPFAEDPEDVRIYFRQVKELFDSLQDMSCPGLDPQWLSMGMSGDFEVAVSEGSNMVRVGTAIFGARDYSKEKK